MVGVTTLLIDEVNLTPIVAESLTRLSPVAVIMHTTIQHNVTADGNLLWGGGNLCGGLNCPDLCLRPHRAVGRRRGQYGDRVVFILLERDRVVGVFVVSALMVIRKILNDNFTVIPHAAHRFNACDRKSTRLAVLADLVD